MYIICYIFIYTSNTMTIEADHNTNTLYERHSPKYNIYWKEVAFSIWTKPIILDTQESNLIVNKLTQSLSNPNIKILRDKLKRDWFRIILDPNMYWSRYNGISKEITLWVKDHSASDAESYFRQANLSPNVNEWILIWTIFVHECAHHILSKSIRSDEIEELNRMIANYIISFNKTLTKLTMSYEWWDKIKDDITELIRMYIINPRILKSHLHFLSTTWDTKILNKYNLHRISKEEENRIYNLIERVVNNYLSN